MRSTILLAVILTVLMSVAGTVFYAKYKAKVRQEAHWEKMFERGRAYAAGNGLPAASNGLPPAVNPTAPAAIQVAGPTAPVKKIDLPWSDAAGASGVLRNIDGCVSLGDESDVIWQGAELFLAAAPGTLRRIWTTDEPGCTFGRDQAYVCFDGRFIWAPLVRLGRLPRLIVVDPHTGQLWDYNGAEGSLPGVPQLTASVKQECRLAVAPLAPGKVCAVIKSSPASSGAANPSGAINTPPAEQVGGTQIWFGTFQFNPPDQPTSAQIAVNTSLDLMEGPLEMLTLVTAGARVVVVGRGRNYPYLIIDPDHRKVTPAASPPAPVSPLLTHAPHKFTLHDSALWRIMSVRAAGVTTAPELLLGRPVLVKASFPDLSEEVVLREPPVGLLASHQGRLHIVGERCWRLTGSGPQIEQVVAEPPWQFDDYLSTGLVITSGAAVQSFPKPAPPAGRDPYSARSVFSSAVYGLLVSASAVQDSGHADDVLYQVAIPATETRPASSKTGTRGVAAIHEVVDDSPVGP